MYGTFLGRQPTRAYSGGGEDPLPQEGGKGLRPRSIFSKAARLIPSRAASWTRPRWAAFRSVAKGCWTVVGRDIYAPYRVLL